MRVILLARDEEEISMHFCHLSSALWSGNSMRSVLTLSTAGLPNRSIGRQGQRKGTPEVVSCNMLALKLLPVPPGAPDNVRVTTHCLPSTATQPGALISTFPPSGNSTVLLGIY